MSIGLTLYVIPPSNSNSKIMHPSFILDLDKTYLIDYFINGEGSKSLKELPNGCMLCRPTYDEESKREVDISPYGVRLTYCNAEDFNNISKSIMKKESSVNKAAIKFIRKLSHHNVIFYYT